MADSTEVLGPIRTLEAEAPRHDAAGEAWPNVAPDQLAMESELREALRQVVDPEINLDVVALGLIREIVFHPDEVEVKIILTTPFCPYAGMIIQQVKDMARLVTSGPARVTLLEDLWSPDMMENADLLEWGLM